jgi:hypothetical protein
MDGGCETGPHRILQNSADLPFASRTERLKRRSTFAEVLQDIISFYCVNAIARSTSIYRSDFRSSALRAAVEFRSPLVRRLATWG